MIWWHRGLFFPDSKPWRILFWKWKSEATLIHAQHCQVLSKAIHIHDTILNPHNYLLHFWALSNFLPFRTCMFFLALWSLTNTSHEIKSIKCGSQTALHPPEKKWKMKEWEVLLEQKKRERWKKLESKYHSRTFIIYSHSHLTKVHGWHDLPETSYLISQYIWKRYAFLSIPT